MRFDLEVISNGEKKIIAFDNVTNIFSDPNSGAEYLQEYRTKDYLRTPETYDINWSDIGMLYITMGLKCNFHCKYCHQNTIRKIAGIPDCTPDKAEKLLEMLKARQIKTRGIGIWGGEPLVYWKAMKALIPGLREMFPDTIINFPTNGSLLDEEKLAFLRKYHIGFYISYDGRITNRDETILDNPKVVKVMRSEKQGIQIMPTQNRKSIPIKELRKEFDDLGIKIHSIAPYSIARCNPYTRDQAAETLIPKEKAQAHAEFLYRALHDDVEHPEYYKSLRERFDHNLRLYAAGIGIDSADINFCANSWGRDVCVDCEGTLYNCMNIPLHKVGSLKEFKAFDQSSIFQGHLTKSKCLSCPYVSVCRGGCPLIHDENSPEFIVNCSNLKILAEPYFRTTVERLLGVYLKRIVRVSDGLTYGEW